MNLTLPTTLHSPVMPWRRKATGCPAEKRKVRRQRALRGGRSKASRGGERREPRELQPHLRHTKCLQLKLWK
jgi:hypothetical protein